EDGVAVLHRLHGGLGGVDCPRRRSSAERARSHIILVVSAGDEVRQGYALLEHFDESLEHFCPIVFGASDVALGRERRLVQRVTPCLRAATLRRRDDNPRGIEVTGDDIASRVHQGICRCAVVHLILPNGIPATNPSWFVVVQRRAATPLTEWAWFINAFLLPPFFCLSRRGRTDGWWDKRSGGVPPPP